MLNFLILIYKRYYEMLVLFFENFLEKKIILFFIVLFNLKINKKLWFVINVIIIVMFIMLILKE